MAWDEILRMLDCPVGGLVRVVRPKSGRGAMALVWPGPGPEREKKAEELRSLLASRQGLWQVRYKASDQKLWDSREWPEDDLFADPIAETVTAEGGNAEPVSPAMQTALMRPVVELPQPTPEEEVTDAEKDWTQSLSHLQQQCRILVLRILRECGQRRSELSLGNEIAEEYGVGSVSTIGRVLDAMKAAREVDRKADHRGEGWGLRMWKDDPQDVKQRLLSGEEW